MQATAGVNSGFADDAYTAVGAEMLPSIEEVYARAEMIVKVKEPVAPEYKLIRRDQLVFTSSIASERTSPVRWSTAGRSAVPMRLSRALTVRCRC